MKHRLSSIPMFQKKVILKQSLSSEEIEAHLVLLHLKTNVIGFIFIAYVIGSFIF